MGRRCGRPLSGHGPSGLSWLPYESPAGDDRQISSEDRRSVKLRVRPPPTDTHQCHRVTPTGGTIMLTVNLARSGQCRPMNKLPPGYHGYRFPDVIISHAVWLLPLTRLESPRRGRRPRRRRGGCRLQPQCSIACSTMAISSSAGRGVGAPGRRKGSPDIKA